MSNDPHPDHGILLVRHAETEWSELGWHTGRTDVPLTEEGRRKAKLIADELAGRPFARVLSSPLERARETCRIAGYEDAAEYRDELREWNYGDYEGLTTAHIRGRHPGWELFTDGAPGGESPDEVACRVDCIVDELCETCEAGGDVVIFGHGHLLRSLAVRWIGLPIATGRMFRLDTGALSTLGWKREVRVVETWNTDAHLRR